jgi:hypothetical protein
MAETSIRRSQDALAEDAAMGMHQREGGIVADCAYVAQMIRKPFKLRHECTQPMRARRRLQGQRSFDSAGKRDGIGDRTVTRNAAGKFRRAIEVSPLHERLDALVRVAQTRFQTNDCFAIRGEAEMSWLDDARMYGPTAI